MAGERPVVVKLGGSFAFSKHLRDWIETLAACAGRVVIVPGGGPFADAVRLAQPRMGFDDHRELATGRVPVWMPRRMVFGATDIGQSWDTTSDSLAAWLVGEIGADRLLLVKHVEFQAGRARFADLAAMGIVDKAFARHLKMSAAAAYILGPRDHDAVIIAVRDGAAAGIPVE
jgi:aspartokinase-like uncharacterized kinase